MMNDINVIELSRIINDLETYTLTHQTAFDVTFGESPDTVTVVKTDEFIMEMKIAFRQMSFTCYDDNFLSGFLQNWTLYKQRHFDEWQIIFNYLQYTADIDPASDHYEYVETSPDLETATEYGRTSTNDGTITTELEHGKTTTTQTNTYDGTLRDSNSNTDSGTDTTTNTLADSNTLSGTDTVTTTGTTTQEKRGYKSNPFENINTAINFHNTHNLRDLIINNFAREFMFYDNDNRGCNYGIYY